MFFNLKQHVLELFSRGVKLGANSRPGSSNFESSAHYDTTQLPRRPPPRDMPPINHPRSHARYRVHLEDLSNPATSAFTKIPNIAKVLQNATENVFKYLYEPHGTPQPVRSVTFILESLDGVAYTTGIPIDDDHKEIHLSLEHISNSLNDLKRFEEECVGVITHEMVHCWQHNCCGTAPGGLIEGIADFVRLKAGLSPPHWKRGKNEVGKKWDEGYQKTAYFLDWLEDVYGKGTVSRINDHMDGKPYREDKFWLELFGESVQTLFDRYVKHWDEDSGKKPPSLASTEPEMVDLTDEEKAAAGAESEQEEKQAREFHA